MKNFLVNLLFIFSIFTLHAQNQMDLSIFDDPNTLQVYVNDFGATPNDIVFDDSAVINAIDYALENFGENKTVVINFEENGIYRFNSDDSSLMMFRFNGFDSTINIKFNGNGATLMSHQLNKGFFRMTRFNKVCFTNLNFDFIEMPHSISKITSIDRTNNSIMVDWLSDSNTIKPDHSIFASGTLSSDYGYFLNSGDKYAHLRGKIVDNSLITVPTRSITNVSGNSYKIDFAQEDHIEGISEGDLFLLNARTNGTTTFRLDKINNVVFDNITIYASSTGTFNVSESNNLSFDNVKVKPKSGRIYATNADGFHLKNNRRISITNSHVESIGDDIVNISQSTKSRIDSISGNVATLPLHAYYTYKVNDNIAFYDAIEANILKRAKIVAIDTIGGKRTFTFSESIPTQFSDNLEGRYWMQNYSFKNVTISGNKFLKSRRHGVLVRHGDVNITNNVVRLNSGSAVSLNIENGTTGSFKEGFLSNNVTIADNFFQRNAFNSRYLSLDESVYNADISIFVRGNGVPTNNILINKINILNNQFNNWNRKAIYATSTRNLIIKGNSFERRLKLGVNDAVIELDAIWKGEVSGNVSFKDSEDNRELVTITTNTKRVTIEDNCVTAGPTPDCINEAKSISKTKKAEKVGALIYPNPSNGLIHFSELGFVQLYTIQGRLVSSFNVTSNRSYNVSDLPKGMYILKLIISEQKQLITRKIIINR
ncbi:Por secretion system C-terminal sorting domain-containing protein [Tenacibaculum sp. MAR_2009_124]|uniref:T9SS type A sorting domain-containing protein n=1 Tax=Tenacibaculum sp. MAR_2009_124 TaxID=1250059 RepID=UPI00089861F7|nr:T9SS type A sorting domain-containing protein [Tenacibaculum sp. MAR_2009_124]SED14097.1 Por secretion system C-terminal sorting domain-containing protein [Tenacibaculum sp. MAR_2009_124]